MDVEEVTTLYALFESSGIRVWIDGGWGVDALLGEQTRPHKDLDIVLQSKDAPKLMEVLNSRGYKQFREDSLWNIVFRDAKGHEVDYHVFIFDEKEENIIGGILYPPESLAGTGSIAGRLVRCIEPKSMIKFHSGYALEGKDFKDVSALCKKFDIPLPDEYTKFIK
jgi:lincosamide nucleotidyltransferase A/C/D/E